VIGKNQLSTAAAQLAFCDVPRAAKGVARPQTCLEISQTGSGLVRFGSIERQRNRVRDRRKAVRHCGMVAASAVKDDVRVGMYDVMDPGMPQPNRRESRSGERPLLLFPGTGLGPGIALSEAISIRSRCRQCRRARGRRPSRWRKRHNGLPQPAAPRQRARAA
jgi:hypothetical protein